MMREKIREFISSSLVGFLIVTPSLAFGSDRPLMPIPEIDHGVINPGTGAREFELTIQQGQIEFFSGHLTKTLGINGPILGPTLKMKTNDHVKIKVKNQLAEETTLHWHGMHLPAEMDGNVHSVIAPNKSWDVAFDIKQPAATLWYHPHVMGNTGSQVYRGLAGLIIIDDEEQGKLGLPSQYGYDDIPVIVQDRKFKNDGQLQYLQSMMDIHMGMMGNRLLINGALEPKAQAPSKLVRLRLLNGSNARIYQMRFNDKRIFYQIATDGGLIEKPVALSELLLTPGERAEILVDFSKNAGQTISLEGFMPPNKPGDKETTFTILPFEILETGNTDVNVKIPKRLTQIDWMSENEAVGKRSFILSMQGMGFTINGKAMNMEVINDIVKVDTTEIWTVESNEMIHNFHIHNIQFQILDRGGKSPYPFENGWKDTVLVAPGEPVRLIMRFEDYTDKDKPYMYHCHILEHEDQGLMGQFVVVPQ